MKRKVVLLLALLFFLCGTAHAAGLTGTIDLTAPAGGTVTVYRVGSIVEGNLLPTEEFAQWDGTLDDLISPDLAQGLARFARDQLIPGTTLEIGQAGSVIFDDLEPGLYLLTQDTAAPGYSAMEPFLVTVPMQIGDDLLYNIDASPKVVVEDRTPAPSTGDDSNIPGLLLIFCLSLAALRFLLGLMNTPPKK